MSVNTLNKEQVYQVLNSLHSQATGEASIAPTDTSEFISMAQKTLAVGYDPVIKAISQVVGQTVFSIRPYSRKFKGLEMDSVKWGGIRRKISISDREAVPNEVYTLTDGAETNPYQVRLPHIVETRYVGSAVFEDYYTITKQQLKTAFSGEAEFGSFMTMLVQNASDKYEQWLEELSRATVSNFITAKTSLSPGTDSQQYGVYHVLTMFNTEVDADYTVEDVMSPNQIRDFATWLNSKISDWTALMTERSTVFQYNFGNYPVQRHTPYEDQKVYLLNSFKYAIDSMVKSNTFHDSYLTLSDYDGVGYWQSIESPTTIMNTPVLVDESGAVVTGDPQNLPYVIGVIFDRDAIGYNIFDDTIDTTPYEAKHKYWTVYHHCDVQWTNDITEKGIVLLLD